MQSDKLTKNCKVILRKTKVSSRTCPGILYYNKKVKEVKKATGNATITFDENNSGYSGYSFSGIEQPLETDKEVGRLSEIGWSLSAIDPGALHGYLL